MASTDAHLGWAFAFAVAGIAAATTAWHHMGIEEREDVRDDRVRIVEACQAEPDTDLDKCVEDMMEKID